jgi:hypothetical protein
MMLTTPSAVTQEAQELEEFGCPVEPRSGEFATRRMSTHARRSDTPDELGRADERLLPSSTARG